MKIPELHDMASQLLAAPSVSSTQTAYDSSNLGVINLLAEWLEVLGFDIQIKPLPDQPGKANLIAVKGQGTDGLVLSGHTDTVPCDELLWHSDPFTLTERNDRWYGLGSCDMKLFFALAIRALADFDLKNLERPITILATADEESSMSGARALTAADLAGAGHAIIGEPTNLVPIKQHKGIMLLALDIQGHSGHSSNPALGNNVIDVLGDVIPLLNHFKDSLSQHQNPLFEVRHPTMNLGCVHGGKNPNRICDQLRLELDMRLLPGMNNQVILSELQQAILPALQQRGFEARLDLMHPPVEPFMEQDDAELLQHLCEFTQRSPEVVSFATEAPFLKAFGMETIVLGPGSIDQAHQPDEYLALDQIEPAIKLLSSSIGRYGMMASSEVKQS